MVLRYSRRVHGLNELVITKLDVLDRFPEVRIAVGYRFGGEEITEFPADADTLAGCRPVYRTLAGWSEPTAGVRRLRDLPREARLYLDTLEELCAVPISLVSTGPDRSASIRRGSSRLFAS